MQNPSPTVIEPADETGQQTGTEHDWDVSGWVPDKPGICDYGYVTMGNAIGCTREELVRSFVARGPAGIKFVWTPDTPQPVFPEKVPLLVPAFKKLSFRAASKNIFLGLGLIGFGVILAFGLDDWSLLYRNIFSIFGVLALVEGVWQLLRSRHYTQEDAEADASSLRFDAWIRNKRIGGYTFVLAAYLVVVGGVQLLGGGDESIYRAGLVKQAVWAGQVWRLFTASLMHASWMHFWMNFLALLHFSRIVERTSRSAYIPLVFLLSAACGSVLSVLLYPNSTSVGASGGLMGLLGFITMAAYVDKRTYPPKYLRNSIEAIAMIGVFGLVGFAFIDNAAHLGGLCGGLLLGWVLLRSYNRKPEAQNISRQVAIPGVAALVALGLVALIAILKILK